MKKKIMIAAFAVALSVTSACATEITGITGQNGVYNITGAKTNNTTTYRAYDKFNLSQGDQANLIMDGKVDTFVNLVRDQISVNGIVNSIKDGNIGGRAVFISPNGMVVGQSGVLNVGHLDVMAPSSSRFDSLMNSYNAGTMEGYQAINSFSSIKGDKSGDINIQGKVFAKGQVDIHGRNVTVDGNIVNGVANMEKLTSHDRANQLFTQLVNTNDATMSDASRFEKNGHFIQIKSANELRTGANSTITDGAGGGAYLRNDGYNGLTANGKVYSRGPQARLYNTQGNLVLNGSVKGDEIAHVRTDSGNLEMGSSAVVEGKEAHVLNMGSNGKTTVNGTVKAANLVSIKNQGSQGLENKANLVTTADNATIAINNYGGDMVVGGTVENKGNNSVAVAYQRNSNGKMTVKSSDYDVNSAGFKTKGTTYLYNNGRNGMEITGDVNNNGTLYIVNRDGEMKFTNARVNNENGIMYALSRDNSTGITQDSNSSFRNSGGQLAISNESGNNGMQLKGTVQNTNGDVNIVNFKGNMDVSGTVKAQNNVSIVNKETAGTMAVGENSYFNSGSVTADNGYMLIRQKSDKDMVVYSDLNNNGKVTQVVAAGNMTLGSNVKNSKNGALKDNAGGFYAVTLGNNSKMNVTGDFTSNDGEVQFRNKGANGMTFNGNVNGTSNAYIVNENCDLDVNGNFKSNYVQVRNKGRNTNIGSSANIESYGSEGHVVHEGTGTYTNNGSYRNIVDEFDD